MAKRLTARDLDVINLFLDGVTRREAYRRIYANVDVTDAFIYRWFKQKHIQQQIIELGNDLQIYDSVCDKVLLDIITSNEAKNSDKIAAIRTWNDLRQRVHQSIKLEAATTIDFTNITDDNLDKIVQKILQIDDLIDE